MEIIDTPLVGLFVIKPSVFEDSRGYFFESFNQVKFDKLISGKWNFGQDNESKSQKGVLRGLHLQNPPYEQGKLVRVVKGSVKDVAVDIRKNSKTFGQYFSIELNETNKLQFFISPGFAHGFLTLEDNTVFSYKCTNFYNKAAETGLLWNDPAININWNIDKPLLSEKDLILPLLKDFKSEF
jgi:dTDP-4-dehydrorhamnose 3,5-epimerase